MRPAAPRTVVAVEAASALYGAPPRSSAPPVRDDLAARASAASSDSDAESDDGWLPVPLEVVSTWRSVAITAAAVHRGSSLDLTSLGLVKELSLVDKVKTLRVVASCNNLQQLAQPPALPAPRPPPLVVPASVSSDSLRCATVAHARARRPHAACARRARAWVARVAARRQCGLHAPFGGALELSSAANLPRFRAGILGPPLFPRADRRSRSAQAECRR